MSALRTAQSRASLHPTRSRGVRASAVVPAAAGLARMLGVGLGTLFTFALTSLFLANLTLTLQKERDALREKSSELSRQVNALDLAAANRQEAGSLKSEAERLGLVATDSVTFARESPDSLTQQ